jgi:hypothetical protein
MTYSSKIYAFLLLTTLCAASPVILSILPLSAHEAETSATQPEMTPGMVPEAEVPFYSKWAGSPHAHRSAEAFNHWNEDGSVPTNCAKCHSTPGFRDFVGADGSAVGAVDQPAPVGTVVACIACHNDATVNLETVTFPSGVTVGDLGGEAICMTCHQGRASSDAVTAALTGLDDDAVSDKLRFINVHYFAAGATLMGSVTRGAYQYPDKSYVGQETHFEPFSTCIACHDMHETKVRVNECATCHKGVTDEASLREIRSDQDKNDYDGDGDVTEGIAGEVSGLQGLLYSAIQTYATSVAGTPVVYDAHSYPYFFVDSNGNGAPDAEELKFPNQFKAWTPRLVRAAYNYQFVEKDPGGYSHNAAYMMQVMYDSIEDLASKANIAMSGAQRP